MIKEFEPFLGKRVCVTRKGDGIVICGSLDWVGYNEHFPNWGLVCTVGRMPAIQIESLLSIELQEDRSIFKK